MSKKRNNPPHDERSKLDLELFMLALVQCEINTPYLLLAKVGLSPGATLPAFNRLEKTGFVRRGKPGSRGRTQYEATATGRRHLEKGWQPLLEFAASGDTESILRTATLAVLSGADKHIIANYLKRAATTKATDSKRRRREAKEAEAARESALGIYRWMRSTHAAARLASEAKILRQFASSMLKRR